MAKTNAEIAQAFLAGKVAQNHGMTSTGGVLLSYGWWEIARWHDGQVLRRKGKSYSITTAGKHRPTLRGFGIEAQEETPVGQAYMNL